MLGYFKYSLAFTAVCFAAAFWWGLRTPDGWLVAVGVTAILAIVEISLSFDNAVVNATVLREMDEKWQGLFLTVGILIAVFGMRLVFPILVVAVATLENSKGTFVAHMSSVTVLAFENPAEYARHLRDAHTGIAAFGGMFLIIGFLSTFCCIALTFAMLVAIITVEIHHAIPKGLGPLDWLDYFLYLPQVLYVILFFWLMISGPGRHSVDHIVARKLGVAKGDGE